MEEISRGRGRGRRPDQKERDGRGVGFRSYENSNFEGPVPSVVSHEPVVPVQFPSPSSFYSSGLTRTIPLLLHKV